MSQFHGGPVPPQRPQPNLPDPGQPEYGRPPKKPMSKEAKIGWGILAGLGTVALVAAALSPDSANDTASVTKPSTVVTTVDTGPSPDPVVTPTNKPSAPVKATTQAPKPTAPKTTEKPKPIVYKKLTARQWAKIAKSPDSHAGETYTVYGRVSQFDSATGDDQFRADVDGVKHSVSYGYVDYPTNTLMTNISGDVSDLVEDDLFTAKVVVIGSFSYDTQIGGETTVPQLSIISITVTGSVK